VTLVRGPQDSPPWLLKTVAPRRHPARVTVLIDADMIVTRSLAELIGTAAEGKVVAFRNRQQRFCPEWGELLDLGPARRQPYVSSGAVFAGGALAREVLGLLADRQSNVDFGRTFWRGDDRSYPFLYADQDVLNAILCTAVEPEQMLSLDSRLAPTPPYRGVRLLDSAALRCAYRDGTSPYLVHQYIRRPWLERMYHGVYSRLLARVLLGDDVSIEVAADEVPLRLRGGARARGERALVNLRDFPRYRFGDLLPEPIGTRLEARRRRREGRGS
jgi:hypothetical protein